MTISFTPDELALAQAGADRRNAANPAAEPWTAEQWAANALGVELAALAEVLKAERRAALVPIADKLIAAPPSVAADVLAYAQSKLS